MDISYERKDRHLRVRLSGELDHHAAKLTMGKLDQLLDAAMPLQLLLDFSGVSFMDSSGIAIVMRAYRHMQSYGGKLVVTDVPPQAKRVLLAANVQRLIQVQ